MKQISDGAFDVNEIVAFQNDFAFVTRTDINHNADLFKLNLKDGTMLQITQVNKENYANLTPSKSELKMVKTSDGKEMGVWFHYPPNFDPNKKYPTLFILSRWSAICINTVFLYSLEFCFNGC